MPDDAHGMIEQEEVKNGICYMCGLNCRTKIHVSQGTAVKIDMLSKSVVESCPRWKAQLDFIYHPERLQYPLKRVGDRGSGSFVRISWDEALDTIANGFQKIKTEYGPESVVFWVAYTKEPRPYFHRLVHAFGSPNYCSESSNCFLATMLAANLTFGEDYGFLAGQSFILDPNSRCELVWTTALKHSFPHIWKTYLKAKEKGLRLIVVDPRRTDIASMADVHLQLRPGTDGALALGLLHVIINEQLYDKEFVEKWTEGFGDLTKLVQEYPPKRVEQITRVPSAKVEEAATLFTTRRPAKVRMSPASTVHSTNGVQNHRAIILLPALTGNLDVPGGNQAPPPSLPTNDITLHERVVNMPPGLGSDRFPIFTQMLHEMQSNALSDHIQSGRPYPIKALFGAGLNIMFFPNSSRLVENLKKLDMIIVSDYFHTPSTQLADIVLPIASWLERQILVTNPGYVNLVEPAIDPVGESWPEWKIFSELAKRLGFGDEFWNGDFERCVSHILEPSGISLEELKQHPEGIRFPITPRPPKHYEQKGFQTPSGKVEISSSILAKAGSEPLPVYKEPMESPVSRQDLVDSFPLVLTSGARTVQFTHSQHRNIPQLRQKVPEPLLEISPSDAEARGIQPGEMVVISSPRGSSKIKADVTDAILPGVVHMPHHWPGEANVNLLVDDQTLDPISGFAPFKSQLCQVSKYKTV